MKKNIILMMIIAVSFLSLGIVIGREKNDNFEEENKKQIKNENTISMMLETEAGSGNNVKMVENFHGMIQIKEFLCQEIYQINAMFILINL